MLLKNKEVIIWCHGIVWEVVKRICKISRLHPLEAVNASTVFQCNPSNGYWDMSPRTKSKLIPPFKTLCTVSCVSFSKDTETKRNVAKILPGYQLRRGGERRVNWLMILFSTIFKRPLSKAFLIVFSCATDWKPYQVKHRIFLEKGLSVSIYSKTKCKHI